MGSPPPRATPKLTPSCSFLTSPPRFFTPFVLGPNTEGRVNRCGKEGSDAKAGQKDPDKADIARAPEFADKAQDPKTFAAWLKVRYPKVTVAGSTVEDMRTDINAKADAGASFGVDVRPH